MEKRTAIRKNKLILKLGINLIGLVLFIQTTSFASELDSTHISGKVINAESDSIKLEGKNYLFFIPLKKDSTFSITVKIPYKGIYQLVINDFLSKSIYLENGFDIHFDIDVNNYYYPLSVSGKTIEENLFLLQEDKILYQHTKQLNDYQKNDEKFQIALENYEKEIASALKNSTITNNYFLQNRQKDLEYNIFHQYYKYQCYYPYGHKKDTDTKMAQFKTETNFPLLPVNFDLNDEVSFYGTYQYWEAIQYAFLNYLDELGGRNKMNVMLEFLQKVTSEAIKNELIKISIPQLIKGEFIEMNYQELLLMTKDSKTIEMIHTLYNEIKHLIKGNISPNFEYENMDGNMISLESFRGKYVYIDIWTTWCVPCKGEIPFLEKIEKEYDSSNIVFISISLDGADRKKEWTSFVQKKQMSGIQLFCNDAFNSDFISKYLVQSIPRFILIDPEGKIVNSNAPRPSSIDIRELFKEHGILPK